MLRQRRDGADDRVAVVGVPEPDRCDEIGALRLQQLLQGLALKQFNRTRLEEHRLQQQVRLAAGRRHDQIELVGGPRAATAERAFLGGDRGRKADSQGDQHDEGGTGRRVSLQHRDDKRQRVHAAAAPRRPCRCP